MPQEDSITTLVESCRVVLSSMVDTDELCRAEADPGDWFSDFLAESERIIQRQDCWEHLRNLYKETTGLHGCLRDGLRYEEQRMRWKASIRCPATGRSLSSSFLWSVYMLDASDRQTYPTLCTFLQNTEVTGSSVWFSRKADSQRACVVGLMALWSIGQWARIFAPKKPLPLPVVDESIPVSDDNWTTWTSHPWQSTLGYLFRLDVHDCGESMRDKQHDTPSSMGLLFPLDIARLIERNDIAFSSPDATPRIRLVHLGPVSSVPLEALKYFNALLCDWKNYGLWPCKDLDTVSTGRTYFVVPLTESDDVAWTMILQSVCGTTRPFHPAGRPREYDCLVLHRKLRYIIRPTHGEPLTASSPFPADCVSDKKRAHFLRRYKIDLRNTTYAEYYHKRYGTPWLPSTVGFDSCLL